jgi:3-oxoacyl-[acyl-carrier protein] reductase
VSRSTPVRGVVPATMPPTTGVTAAYAGARICDVCCGSLLRQLTDLVGSYGAGYALALFNTAQILTKLHSTEQSRADSIKQNIPAGYFGEPYDIGHLVAFLASPLARYINGAAIPVDGRAVRRAL